MNFEKPFAVLLAAGVVLLQLPGDAPAGCRAVVHHRHQQQAAVVFQPVYQQPYWYSVGQNYQIAAIVQETLKAQQLLQNQQQLNYSATPKSCPDGTCPTPQTLPLTAPSPYPISSAKCVSCHSGTNAKATEMLDLTNISAIDCETKLVMIREAVAGRMPKGRPLSAQELGDFIGELAGEPPSK